MRAAMAVILATIGLAWSRALGLWQNCGLAGPDPKRWTCAALTRPGITGPLDYATGRRDADNSFVCITSVRAAETKCNRDGSPPSRVKDDVLSAQSFSSPLQSKCRVGK